MRAFYSNSIDKFVSHSPQAILGELAARNPFALDPLQRNAWQEQINLLQGQFAESDGWIALEFSIPRMGKRADAILIMHGVIFVLEFKVGTTQFDASAIEQATDYALDLKNFHAGSHHRPIVPIVVATGAGSPPVHINWDADQVAHCVKSNGTNLRALVDEVSRQLPAQSSLDGPTWSEAGYRPTPTIIEAAQALYQGHRVEDITRSDAGAKNLGETANCLADIIEKAKANGHKAICFVTGVPGAGKTLAGLNLVTQRTRAHQDEHAVFLSGNGPLVEVLREALARDEYDRARHSGINLKKTDATRKVTPFIQNIMHFRDSSVENAEPPVDRVAVFDEAQRAWDQDHLSKFMRQKRGQPHFQMSEPEFLIRVMDRHEGWCVIICLVGGGQEINAGEAGLTEWFFALRRHFADWRIYTSNQLAHRDYGWGQDLAAELKDLNSQTLSALHLSVSVRSFRAEALSDFVGAVVAGEADAAKHLYDKIKTSYPIALTRSLAQARQWLRTRARGTERIGLVASSGASRLKPEGINVHEKIDAPTWFLNGRNDVRSSFYMEDPATEFDIQGLELDWVGVCWDADFRAMNGQWQFRRFVGTDWQNVKDSTRRAYLTNAYRVLLTRARQGMVIYVPAGASDDATRLPEFYDGTAQFLLQCGIPQLR